eukprot:3863387-Rhodomonas_salina.1
MVRGLTRHAFALSLGLTVLTTRTGATLGRSETGLPSASSSLLYQRSSSCMVSPALCHPCPCCSYPTLRSGVVIPT